MYSKILLLAFSAAAFVSCSTVYKSGQTPDDVYYSPVRLTDDSQNNNKEEQTRTISSEDRTIHMGIRDHRFRTLNDEYDYSYNRSPYGYCSCSCNNDGYYYNPYYAAWPVYYPTVIYTNKLNSTPRMIDLKSYNGYANAGSSGNLKGGNGNNWMRSSHPYNNSNRGSFFGNAVRQILTPGNNNTPSNNNNNNTRSYTPSSSGSNNSGNSSSGNNSSGNSVPRPKRGA